MQYIKRIALVLGVCSLVIVPSVTRAAEMKAVQNFSITKSEVIGDNLYVAEKVGVIEGMLKKDLVTAGGNLLVTGTVERDIIAAGGTLELLGDVGGNVRAIGGTIIIDKNVDGDVVIAGGMVHIAPGATVKGDVIVAAGQLIIDGTVKGDVVAAAKDVFINGTIGRDVSIKMNQRLTLGKSARIEGNLQYRSVEQATIDLGATIKGKTVFEKIEQPRTMPERTKSAIVGMLALLALLKLLALIVTAVVIVLVFKKSPQALTDLTLEHFGREVVRGFVVLIVLPIAAIVLVISLIGSIFGIVMGLLYGLLLMIASVMSAIVFGAWLVKVVKKTNKFPVTWQSAVIGSIALYIIGIIPIIGWLIAFAFFLATLGGMWLMLYQKMWMKR